MVAQLAPEPGGTRTAFTETLVKIGGVVIDAGLADARRWFWIGLSASELLDSAVIKIQLPPEFSIGSPRLEKFPNVLPSFVSSLPVSPLYLALALTPWRNRYGFRRRILVWFMDTGANISVMSDAEAAALGLEVVPVATTMDDISGTKTSTRVALVPDLLIGRTHLRHDGFVVLPHTQPPFDDIPTEQQALLGIQVLRALGTIRVDRTEQVELGGRGAAGGASRMAFDDNTPVVEMATGGRSFAWTFDTGAVRTTLNQPFAAAFPKFVAEGKQKDYKLTGVGGSTQQKSVELSRVLFTLGGKEVTLAPATVLLNQTSGTSKWAARKLGI